MVDRQCSLKHGVKLGVEERLPRAPSLYERKVRFRKYDEEMDGTDPVSKANYKSVKDNLETVKRMFEEEADLGMMREE
eukprot:5839629-Karenia_brevis.AAC.1